MKEGIGLDYPIGMGDAKQLEYARNGILFKNRMGGRFSTLETPFNLTVADFASLSKENLTRLVPHLARTEYEPIVDMALRTQKLVEQVTTISCDGFHYPVGERPFTWPLHERVGMEISKQLESLRSLGVDEVKIGLEMEFSCNENPVDGFNYWEERKIEALRKLEGEKNKDIENKIESVKKFNAREMMMFDLIEMDENTRGVLEPLFGTTRDGNGYYDSVNVLELKTKPALLQEVLENRKIVLKTLYEKAIKYGLEIPDHPSCHINVSFWDGQGNILDDKHPEFAEKSKLLTEGITKAFYDAIAILIDKNELSSNELIKLSLSVNRQNLLRYSTDRIEIRPSVEDFMQDVDLMVAVLLSGAIYGLSVSDDKEMIKAERVECPVVHHAEDCFKVVSHAINNSTIREDGSVEVSEEYLREHSSTLEYELGLVSKEPGSDYASSFLRMFFTSDYLEMINYFFGKMKVINDENGKMVLKFPETSKGRFEYTIPDINMDKIPEEMQRRLRSGQEVNRGEYDEYLKPGERLPHPARVAVINVAELAEKISLKGCKSKFVVKDYDLNRVEDGNTPERWSRAAWARYVRQVNSKVLQMSLSSEFVNDFADLVKKYSEKKQILPLKDISEEEVVNMLFGKIADNDYVIDTRSEFLLKSELGRGLISPYVQIDFIGVENGRLLESILHQLLKDLGDALEREKSWFDITVSMYVNQKYKVSVQIKPEFLKILEELIPIIPN